jgi:hypothetical protein
MKKVMMTILGALALAACTEPDPLYCDEATPCSDPGRPYCDLIKKECVADSNQVPDLSIGDMAMEADLAMPCASSAACAAAAPICESAACRPCAGPADDAECAVHNAATPRCGASGQCARCRPDTAATDCPMNENVCENGACRACTSHGDCPSGICLDSGGCAAEATVTYVDNGGMDVTSCQTNRPMRDGTQAKPYCNIQEALDASRNTIKVSGSAQPYGAVTVDEGNGSPVHIVGPGVGVAAAARVFALANDALTVNVSNAPAAMTIIIDGLDIGGSTGLNVNHAVRCTRSGASPVSLHLRGSFLHHANGELVDATDCNVSIDRSRLANSVTFGVVVDKGSLTLRRSRIEQNLGGGIELKGGPTYSLQNSMIFRNNGVALKFDNNAAGTLSFLTVAENGALNSEGAIDCGSDTNKPRLVEYSILALNARTAGANGTQIKGNQCVFQNVVAGSAETSNAAGIVKLDPVFASTTAPFDYRLKTGDAANVTCCVDKVAPASVDGGAAALPSGDVDGTARPKGAAWDVGAHELQ